MEFEIIFIKEEPNPNTFSENDLFFEIVKANNSEEAEGIIINKYNIPEDFIRSIYEI